MNGMEQAQYRRGMAGMSVQRIRECPFGWVNGIKILYVLEGNITIELHKDPEKLSVLELGKDGIYAFGNNEIHRIYSTEADNTVLFLYFDYDAVCRLIKCADTLEFDFPANLEHDILNEMKQQVILIARCIMFPEDLCENHFTNLTEQFVLWSLSHLEIIHRKLHRDKQADVHIERLLRVTDYIQKNIAGKDLLNKIAKQEFLNADYISRELKNKLDYSFQQLMNFYRTQEAIRELLVTDWSISEIAVGCGFSAQRYFYKEFGKFFPQGPSEFRRKYQNAETEAVEISEERVKQLLQREQGETAGPAGQAGRTQGQKDDRRHIRRVVLELLDRYTPDEITAERICREGKISKKILYNEYYCFADIFEDLCRNELLGDVLDCDKYSDWLDGFSDILFHLHARKKIVSRIFHSCCRDKLMGLLTLHGEALLKSSIGRAAQHAGIALSEQNRVFLLKFYMYIFLGVIEDYIHNDMEEEPAELTCQLDNMLRHHIQDTISHFPVSHSPVL